MPKPKSRKPKKEPEEDERAKQTEELRWKDEQYLRKRWPLWWQRHEFYWFSKSRYVGWQMEAFGTTEYAAGDEWEQQLKLADESNKKECRCWRTVDNGKAEEFLEARVRVENGRVFRGYA